MRTKTSPPHHAPGARIRGLSVAVAVSVAATALSACGTASSAAQNGSTGTASIDTAALKAEIKKFETGETKYSGPTEAVKAPSNVQLAVIPCSGALEGCTAQTKGAAALAEKLGWTVKTYDAKATPSGSNDAIQQAIIGGANVILTGAVPPEFIKSGLAEAKKKGIIVGDMGGGFTLPASGEDLVINVNTGTWGTILGKFLVAETGGKANVLPFTDESYAVDKPIVDNLIKALKGCGTCKVQPTQKFVGTDITSTLGPKVINLLRQDPTINYVYLNYDGAAAGVIPQLVNAGLTSKVKVVAVTGGKQNLQYIIDKHVQTADVAHDGTYLGYMAVYQVARLLNKMPLWETPGVTDPLFVYSGNVPSKLFTWTSPPPSSDIQYNADETLHYQAKFDELLGVH